MRAGCCIGPPTTSPPGPSSARRPRSAPGVAGLLAGDSRAVVETERAVAAAERLGLGWLARVGRAALAVARSPVGAEYARSDATAVREAAAREEDRWGEALAALAEGWSALDEPEAALEPLEAAATRFRGLGAGSLEAWARGLAALAMVRAGAPDAREAALGAEAVARSTGVAVAQAVAHVALAELDAPGADELRAAARGLLEEAGLVLPGHTDQRSEIGAAAMPAGTRGAPPGPTPPAEVRLFGAFAMAVGGRAIDLAGLKPRPRALLRFLALNEGKPIHREVLQETFWPEADGEAGAKSLHVALSALRRELAPHAERGACELLVREGDAYRLTLPAGSRIDLAEFEEAIVAARRARSNGSPQAAVGPYRAVLAAYGGELLPEDGPAEWAAGRRDRTRAEVVEAARGLADLLLHHDPEGAAEACTVGLAVDPYHDPLWRLLVEARERAGDQAAATSARSGYARMLSELGVAAADPA